MQLKTLLLLASVTLTAAAAAAVAEPAAAQGDIEIPAALAKRGCSKNGCACHKGIKAGLYCGSCAVTIKGNTYWAISKKWNAHHVYQCGSSGSCCDYGTASDCGTSKGRCASGSSGGGF